MSAPLPAARETELQQVADIAASLGTGSMTSADLMSFLRYAYSLGKVDGMDRGADIYRKAFERLQGIK